MEVKSILKLVKIDNASSLNIYDWEKCFEKHEQATIAHSFSVGLILEKTYGYLFEPYKILKDNKVVGFVPFCRIGEKLVSMPHFSYGGVLDDVIDSKENLVKLFKQLDCKKFERRGFNVCSPYFSDEKISCFLKLESSSEVQMAVFKSKLRSQIKKGVKNGLQCNVGGMELLNDFYDVYGRNMHDLGSPVLTKLFFQNLIDDYKDGMVNILVVYHNQKAIGASFLISYFDFMEVCWASTIRKYNYLQPNMVLYWEMISYAIKNGMKIFSFGRSTKNTGTHKFKKQWGCEDVQLYFNFSEEQKGDIKKAIFLMKLWRKIPYKLAIIFGPFITKRIY